MRQAPERATFGAVLAIGEFRALWGAELFSVAGDQLARVALAVLVFTRTESAALTTLTYALTFVPALLGGVLLGGLGDRYPRREVMVGADLVRAVLVALMAVPRTPLWLLCVLVAAMTLFAGPFKAAQQALLPDVLPGEKYMVGQSIRNSTTQFAQLIGFAGGGLVAAINPSVGLVLDACTFLLSAVILRYGVRPRPAATVIEAHSATPATYLGSIVAGARMVWRDPGLRALIALCWLAGFFVAPEALAAPYAASVGAGAGAVGLIMASDPAGSVVGAFVIRWVPEHVRVRVVAVLGVLAGVPLVLCALRPGLVVSMVLFAVSGLLAAAYTQQAQVSFTLRLPNGQRAQGSGLLSSGLITVQGLGALAAGVLADRIGAVPTVAVAGAAGAIAAIPIAVGWHRARTNPARDSRASGVR